MKNIVVIESNLYYTLLLESYCKHPEITRRDYNFSFFDTINSGIDFISINSKVDLVLCDLFLSDSLNWKSTIEKISFCKKNDKRIAIIAEVSEEKMQQVIRQNLKNDLSKIDEYIIKDNINFNNFHTIISFLLGESYETL